MNRDRKRERRRNVFSILGLLALLMYILQLWPVLVLILGGMVVYVFWLLFGGDGAERRLCTAAAADYGAGHQTVSGGSLDLECVKRQRAFC